MKPENVPLPMVNNVIDLTNKQIIGIAQGVASLMNGEGVKYIFPIPRGGIPAAYALMIHGEFEIVTDPYKADAFIDDIIDSGATMKQWCDDYPNRVFYALVDKNDVNYKWGNQWVSFPWERTEIEDKGLDHNIRRFIQYIGDDTSREGLIDTPARVSKAMRQWYSGYGKDPAEVLKVFEDGGENYNQMVVVKDIPIYSKCEHHMADIFGTVTIAYIPNGKIVGLSKLSRVADIFARRLQVQERLTQQIADALENNLSPKGVAVMVKARHMCMESRGICKQGHHTITTAFHGAFLKEAETRAEFMSLAR